MKVKPKQYALTLYEITKDVSKNQIEDVIKDFVKLVVKKGDLKQWPQIIENFSKIFNQKNNIAEITVRSKNKLTQMNLEKLEEKLKKIESFKDFKKFKFIQNIDNELIGGIKIEFEDKVIDAGLKNRVEQLKIHMSKN